MYYSMQSLSSFALGLGVVFSLLLIASGSSLPILNGPRARSLASRQIPGVVTTSDFLRRAGHASVVAGDWVYIDGGEFSFMSDGTPIFQYSSTILSIGLSETWTNSSVTIHSTFKPKGLPDLMYPSLWYDEQENILYSGFAGWVSGFGDSPSPSPLSLWSFKPDGAGSGSWEEVIDSGSPVWDSMTRPGSPMMAFGSGSAYALGGFESSQTALSAANSKQAIAIPGLIQFNMTTKKFSNSTVGGYSFNGTAEKGAMHYVPSFGPKGLFVVMGGDDVWHPDPESVKDLETISIYDPSSEQWFNQTTTGNIPRPREEFCLAGVESNSDTYEIFMYAGWEHLLGADAIPFDEIYILTLPAFYWIKVDYPPQNPCHGLTCNAVGGSQVLTIGGLDTNPKEYTYHSPYNSTPDPFAQGLAIFDMTTLKFADQYTAKAPPYVQSDRVKTYYETRLATKFNSPQLAQLLSITHFANTTTDSPTTPTSPTQPSSSNNSHDSPTTPTSPTQPSSSNNSHKTPVGDITGGVVGGMALLVLLCVLVFLQKGRSRGPKHLSFAEVSGESERRQEQGLQEMYQMTQEMEANPQQGRVTELREDSAHSPVELGGLEMFELNGSAY